MISSRYIPLLPILLVNTWCIGNAQEYHDYIPDNITNWANFSVIADPLVRNMTMEFHKHCPFTRLCTVETYFGVYPMTFRYLGDTREKPCCASCECSKNCYEFYDCCPDILRQLLSHEDVFDLRMSPEQCVASQYRPFPVNDNVVSFYKEVTTCPEYYDNSDVKVKCETEYHLADFPYVLTDIIPVTDVVTNVTYRNSNCAECRGSPRTNLVYLDVKIICKDTVPPIATLVKNPDDILTFIHISDNCNIHFQIPGDLHYVKVCDPYIDRCNVTGNWAAYDPLLERACHSYTSKYKGYKNIHCSLCNGHNESDIDFVCLKKGVNNWTPSSFTALLDFNNLENTDQDSNTGAGGVAPCGAGEVFDYDEDVCRELVCPSSTVLQNGTCKQLFAYETAVIFDVDLRMFPDTPDKLQQELWLLRENIIGDVHELANDMSSASVGVCNVEMFLKFEKTIIEIQDIWPQDKVSTMIKAKTEYIDVRIKLFVKYIEDTDEFITEVFEMFENMRQLYQNWTTVYTYIDDAFFDSSNYIYAGANPLPPGEDGHVEWVLMVFPFDDPIDGQAVNPYPPLRPYKNMEYELYCSAVAVKLTPKHSCPKVEISVCDSLAHAPVNITTDLGFNLSDVVLFDTDDGSKLLICHKDFSGLQRTKTVPRPIEAVATSGYSAEVILSIVCSLASMVCLSVTFLAYCMLPSLRTVPGINNMALVIHLFLAQMLYLIGGTLEIGSDRLCKIIGVLLHYMLISSFLWMFVCTFHMLRVFVSIGSQASQHNGRYINVKYVVLAEVPALVVIAVTVLVSLLTTDMQSIGYGGQLCYISDADMIYYTVGIPLGGVVVSNLCMFVFVVVTISRLPDIRKNTTHERSNILIFIKLSTITGLTWIFAFIYQWTEVTALRYLFIILNGCQGVFIMVSFVMNKRVLNLIKSKRAIYSTNDRRTMQ